MGLYGKTVPEVRRTLRAARSLGLFGLNQRKADGEDEEKGQK
jgi:hypothetical protein